MVELVGVVVVLAFLGAAALMIAKRGRQEQEAWESVARDLGLTFDPGTTYRIHGTLEGQAVQLRREARGGDDHREIFYVFESLVTPAFDLGLRVTRPGFPPRVLAGSFGRLRAQVGNPELDPELTICCDEPGRAQALLDPELQELIQGLLLPKLVLEMTDAGFKIQLPQISEPYAQRLKAGLQSVADIARCMEEARDRIPVAADLAAHQPRWQSFAQAAGLQSLHTPLCMSGVIDGAKVSAHAVRSASATYAMDVLVQYPQPLGIGLLIRPAHILDAVGTFFGGQDEKLGDAAFDKAFVVQVVRKDELARVVDAQVRARILELHQGPLAILLRDDGVVLRSEELPQDPTEVPRLVAQLRSLAVRVGENARGPTGQAGPYR